MQMKSKGSAVEMSAASVFLIDDHPIFREGLARIIATEKDLTVCGEASEADEALQKLATLKPDLVTVDVSLDTSANGIDLTKTLRSRYPNLKILVLSMHSEALHAERALRAGANGYIMKRENGRTLLAAMRQVLAGQVYISRELNEVILHRMSTTGQAADQPPLSALSDRELEIFQLIGEGYGTRQIADKLHISVKTIESHREHIREKLDLNTNFRLVQRAIHWVHRESDSR